MTSFKWRHFQKELILIAVRWYVTYSLSIKYLNNIIEQDHRGIKRITHPMMGFKAFHSSKATLAGIELHRMLKKGQHNDAANSTIFEQFYVLAA